MDTEFSRWPLHSRGGAPLLAPIDMTTQSSKG